MSKTKGPRILLVDIETSPLEVFTWGLRDQNIGLNQIIKDWSILSFAAKWADSSKIIYMDTSKQKNLRDDKKVVSAICKLLAQADVVVSHYGKKFDIPKIDTRRLKHKLPMFPMPKHEDTKFMANKYSFTSNKLEYIGNFLDIKHKKLVQQRKFHGMDLWKECLIGNKAAWSEMAKYNKQDVFALQDVYELLKPRGSTINPSLYNDDSDHTCICGSKEHTLNGYAYTSTGKYQRFLCKECNRESRGRVNLLSKEKRQAVQVKT